MSNDFGVCLTAEYDTLALKPAFELRIVFDDSIMNDSDCAAYVCLRMCIDVARLAMRGPSRVSDSERAFYCFVRNALLKNFKSALCLANNDVFTVKYSNAGRIVTAVRQFF